MENLEKWTFYRSYYEAGKYMPDVQKLEYYEKLFSYLFYGKETESEWIVEAVFQAVKPNLKCSRERAIVWAVWGSVSKNAWNKHASKIKAKSKQNQSNVKEKEKENIKDNIEYSNNKELNTAIVEWIDYKTERREWYKPSWLKSFLTQCHKYTPESVIKELGRASSNGWKWVVWDNCKEIPKFSSEYDFTSMEEPAIFDIVKNKRSLVPQLEHQNPKVYKSLKFALNTLEEYGC